MRDESLQAAEEKDEEKSNLSNIWTQQKLSRVFGFPVIK
jgi:hypothetical protein